MNKERHKLTDLLITLAFVYCVITLAVLIVCWSFNLMFSFKLTIGVSVLLAFGFMFATAVKEF